MAGNVVRGGGGEGRGPRGTWLDSPSVTRSARLSVRPQREFPSESEPNPWFPLFASFAPSWRPSNEAVAGWIGRTTRLPPRALPPEVGSPVLRCLRRVLARLREQNFPRVVIDDRDPAQGVRLDSPAVDAQVAVPAPVVSAAI